MGNKSLENKARSMTSAKTANERAYLNGMMSEVRQEGYTCVSGCQSCISCGGNDFYPKKK